MQEFKVETGHITRQYRDIWYNLMKVVVILMTILILLVLAMEGISEALQSISPVIWIAYIGFIGTVIRGNKAIEFVDATMTITSDKVFVKANNCDEASWELDKNNIAEVRHNFTSINNIRHEYLVFLLKEQSKKDKRQFLIGFQTTSLNGNVEYALDKMTKMANVLESNGIHCNLES